MTRWLVVSVVLALLGGAVITGCVPREVHNKALAAAQRANAELRRSQLALQVAQDENQNVRADLARRQQEVGRKDKLIASLETEKEFLNDSLTKLKDLYDKVAGRKPPPLGTIRVLPARVDEGLRALAGQNAALMEYLPEYGMIKLKGDLTFDKGSTVVKPQAVAALKKLAEIVNTDAAKEFHVYVAGHTDDIPLVKPQTIRDHGTNWGLSSHRALAVVKALFEAGVDQARMGAVGFGKHHPIVPNRAGNKGHPLNRRVEIWIVPPDRFLTAGGTVAPAAPEEVAPQK